jgi:hypothetical protein
MAKYLQGRFSPKNPEKYKGDPSQIYYRSSWELTCMLRFDNDPNVIEWSSEEIVIPYKSPIDGKFHRYFPDFRVKTSQGKTLLIEIKPFAQTQPPKKPKKITKRFIQEVATYGVNEAKWKAAKEYSADRLWEFKVLTENDLPVTNK